jgi:exopolyphosphatase / guanosine-5'-triphosphate,3'-diphosphate pyrophosphatase
MTITRLGAGVDANGHLDDAALDRTLSCIAGYARRWRELDARRIRVAATSAVRDASDRDRFFDGVRAIAGVDAEVLTPEEEAATAFRGATCGVSGGTPPWLVLDIGGGSTEFIFGDADPEVSTSRQLGCVRLTERALTSDPPTAADLAAARRIIHAELEAVTGIVAPGRARTLVGVAGTVTTIGALHLGLADYEPDRIHATRVPLEAVRTITAKLGAMPALHRAGLGPMVPGREDVIVGGALILEAVMERFDFAEVLVSEADILDGLAMGLLDPSDPG